MVERTKAPDRASMMSVSVYYAMRVIGTHSTRTCLDIQMSV